jgi:hypothetical protein
MRFTDQDKKASTGGEFGRLPRPDLAELAYSLRQHLNYQAIMGLEWLPCQPLTSIQGLPETLEQIRADLGECTRCQLHSNRTHIVFGEGNPAARVVLVGEGPGQEEDRLGRPFVGAAGKLLDRIIAAMGWRRDEIYICNVIKCRPPRNRDPQVDEIEQCGPFGVNLELFDLRPFWLWEALPPNSCSPLSNQSPDFATAFITLKGFQWFQRITLPIFSAILSKSGGCGRTSSCFYH